MLPITPSLPDLVSLAAALSGNRQTDRLMRLHTPLDSHYGPDTLIPETLQGSEVIGTQSGATPSETPITG
ncbi:MAG: hypothetical protein P4L77_13100, partial [Sulfuriferula sp.]|nr:hypothetical protein [Sulfuriferula sp.]